MSSDANPSLALYAKCSELIKERCDDLRHDYPGEISEDTRDILWNFWEWDLDLMDKTAPFLLGGQAGNGTVSDEEYEELDSNLDMMSQYLLEPDVVSALDSELYGTPYSSALAMLASRFKVARLRVKSGQGQLTRTFNAPELKTILDLVLACEHDAQSAAMLTLLVLQTFVAEARKVAVIAAAKLGLPTKGTLDMSSSQAVQTSRELTLDRLVKDLRTTLGSEVCDLQTAPTVESRPTALSMRECVTTLKAIGAWYEDVDTVRQREECSHVILKDITIENLGPEGQHKTWIETDAELEELLGALESLAAVRPSS